jgi:hypothetical protein
VNDDDEKFKLLLTERDLRALNAARTLRGVVRDIRFDQRFMLEIFIVCVV